LPVSKPCTTIRRCGSFARDNKIRHWSDLGEFQSIEDTAHYILQLEKDKSGALFFRVYADPAGEKSDAEILCRLE
jgi:hypothetical protein